MPNPKDFPKPLEEWIEEKIPVSKNTLDPKTGKITTITQLENMRTKYMDVPYEKMSCANGKHEFKSVNPKKWLFGCKNCPLRKRISPGQLV